MKSNVDINSVLKSRLRGGKYRIAATISKDLFIKFYNEAQANRRTESNLLEIIIEEYFKNKNK